MDEALTHPVLGAPAREQLAKQWLLEVIEDTPLAQVGELSVSRLAAEAPPLIDAILEALAAGSPAALDADARARAERLAMLRPGPAAPEAISHDLAALHRLLLESLEREPRGRERGDLARMSMRLAAVFGAVQGAVARALVAGRTAGEAHDPVTGLPGPAELDRRLRTLLAEQRRYGRGFALALIDVEGLARINDAYGRGAGDRMLVGIAAILRRRMREADQAFRLEEDEFAVVAPHTGAERLVVMATRIARLIAGSQSADGPLVALAAGVVDCPGDGLSAERLLESATEATYAAKASGAAAARSPDRAPAVQDS